MKIVSQSRSGGQAVPGYFVVDAIKEYPDRFASLGLNGDLDESITKPLKRLTETLITLRYCGPIFISMLQLEGDRPPLVLAISSRVFPGFWAAFSAACVFRDGIGKALLHAGRMSLKNSPEYRPISVVRRHASLGQVPTQMFEKDKTLYTPIDVDPSSGEVFGETLGWFSTVHNNSPEDMFFRS